MTIWRALLQIEKVCCENAENTFSYRWQVLGGDEVFCGFCFFCDIEKSGVCRNVAKSILQNVVVCMFFYLTFDVKRVKNSMVLSVK